jgi:FdhD protein
MDGGISDTYSIGEMARIVRRGLRFTCDSFEVIEMSEGAVSIEWYEYRNGWSRVNAEVIEEAIVTIYVNGMELATIMATPSEMDCLAIGFLKNERLIESLDSVQINYQSKNRCCVDVWLDHSIKKPERIIITSGCGGGITFNDPYLEMDEVVDGLSIHPDKLFELFRKLHFPGSLYSRSRGVHTAGLSDGKEILAVTEDVGRHNAVDKLLGKCLLNGIETQKRILLTTGRVSSEMLREGAMMGCPIIASRNSATSMSVEMAQAWNITLIGYVRNRTMRVYSHPERLFSSMPATE